jgi:hypothetical protein
VREHFEPVVVLGSVPEKHLVREHSKLVVVLGSVQEQSRQ